MSFTEAVKSVAYESCNNNREILLQKINIFKQHPRNAVLDVSSIKYILVLSLKYDRYNETKIFLANKLNVIHLTPHFSRIFG